MKRMQRAFGWDPPLCDDAGNAHFDTLFLMRQMTTERAAISVAIVDAVISAHARFRSSEKNADANDVMNAIAARLKMNFAQCPRLATFFKNGRGY